MAEVRKGQPMREDATLKVVDQNIPVGDRALGRKENNQPGCIMGKNVNVDRPFEKGDVFTRDKGVSSLYTRDLELTLGNLQEVEIRSDKKGLLRGKIKTGKLGGINGRAKVGVSTIGIEIGEKHRTGNWEVDDQEGKRECRGGYLGNALLESALTASNIRVGMTSGWCRG
ncbi:hypothetical protein LIER_42956 [Lithospermum erythrorhizon]|uniref:Uncharacterized protein n=1 Tax=Lithospermum erythrorhizon TaxID=34254 RepID=A0AAV3P761_LITER